MAFAVLGHYLFLESSSPASNGDTANLTSPVFEYTDREICFSFWYNMYGLNIGTLKVYEVIDTRYQVGYWLLPVYICIDLMSKTVGFSSQHTLENLQNKSISCLLSSGFFDIIYILWLPILLNHVKNPYLSRTRTVYLEQIQFSRFPVTH